MESKDSQAELAAVIRALQDMAAAKGGTTGAELESLADILGEIAVHMRPTPEPSEAAIEAAREATARHDIESGPSLLPRRLTIAALRAAYAVDFPTLAGPPPAGEPSDRPWMLKWLTAVIGSVLEARQQATTDAQLAAWIATTVLEEIEPFLWRAALRGQPKADAVFTLHPPIHGDQNA